MSIDCLVIGAGMAGLAAARHLDSSGWRVTVLDKGRGFGGRMATRRMGSAKFDHGAQYFTARSPEFAQEAERWSAEGMLKAWFRRGDEDRFVGVDGMSALARHIAAGLDVQLSQTVATLHRGGTGWVAETAEGGRHEARCLVVTAPAWQSLQLLKTHLRGEERAELEAIEYHPCFALMALYDEPSVLPDPGCVGLEQGPVAWIADNRRKFAGGGGAAITIHATPEFTRERYDAPQAEVSAALLAAAHEALPGPPVETQLHRWRFAQVSRAAGRLYLTAPDRDLVVAGDGFGGPRVEGAFLSGLAAARTLTES